jgi:hypothetical protein
VITFTNRFGGVSAGNFTSLNLGDHVGDDLEHVIANRDLLAGKYGPIQYMNQTHGNRIAIIEEVTPAFAEDVPTADALVTGISGITLAVMVADCIPLILTSKEAVAAVHVGRKGLTNGIAERTISVMREIGALEISAIIGPAICGSCYEISQEIFDEVIASHPGAASKTVAGSPALDLVQGLIIDLQRLQISNIDNQSRCTHEHEEYFSYRRDGVTGRQVGMVSL